MTPINSDLLRKNSRVEDALDLFRAVIEHNGLQAHRIQDMGTITLPFLNDIEGWLGSWMLKSDELAAYLLKARLWNAVYVKDSTCVQAIRPINRTIAEDNGDCFTTYDRYPLAQHVGIPMSLRFVVANLAFLESLVFHGREVNIRPIFGFYDLQGEMEEGDILPFQRPSSLGAQRLNAFILEANQATGPHSGLNADAHGMRQNINV